MTSPEIVPLSSSALLLRLGEHIDLALTRRIARFVGLVDAAGIAGLRDVIPAYTTALVEYDRFVTSASTLGERLLGLWAEAEATAVDNISPGRLVDIPVVYGGAHGADLDRVAQAAGMSPEEVVKRHAAGEYMVGALGFAPGFAYLIGLPPELATPRLARPRLAVPAGSIGIGGVQTGIYALPTPGGWSLIGRTSLRLFDPAGEDPFTLRMGDRVHFRPIDARELAAMAPEARERDESDAAGDLELVTPGMQTTVQDLGRPGFGRYGVSPNGAADRGSLIAANRLVGNPDDAAGLEITITGPRIRVHRAVRVALAGADLGASVNGEPLGPGQRRSLLPGDELAFAPRPEAAGARAYLAVAGGIDVPVVMGSRSTDLTAGFGGFRGRVLRAGDRLAIGTARRPDHAPMSSPTVIDPARPFRVWRGPQADRFSRETWDRFWTRPFTISSESNRVGLRLTGPAIVPVDGADIVSEGIVTGAIQVTGEGQPIVMLPGHATIGGYTKIATVIDEDLDRLGQLRPGDVIRFREAGDAPPVWTLRDFVRLARLVIARGVGEFVFEDHATGARLRAARRHE